MKRTRHIGSFRAVGTESGDEYVVHIFQDFIETRNSMGSEELPGLKSLRTDDGRAVNRRDKGKYEVIGFNGEPLTSDDPNAP